MKFKHTFIGTLLAWSGAAQAVEVGEAMPEVLIKTESGAEALSNSAMSGKVTLINFWATWCAACKVELIEMEEQLEPYLTDKDFRVAFVSLDKDPAKASAWFQANLKNPDLFLKHLYNDAGFEAADKLKVDSFPMTLVIGKDGRVAHVQKGFKEGEESTKKLVKVSSDLLKATAH